MKNINQKQTRELQKRFLESFKKEFIRQPIIEDLDRSLRAVSLLVEHIRLFYGMDRTLSSLSKISKYSRSLLVLENCNHPDCIQAVHEAELQLLDESMTRMNGLNGMELALSFKKSVFSDVRDAADDLMDQCSYRRVISNGAE